MTDLLGFKDGVDRDEGSASPCCGKAGHDGFRALVEKNADAFAAIETEGHQAAGEAANLIIEFAIAEGAMAPGHCRRCGRALCRCADEFVEKRCCGHRCRLCSLNRL